MATGVLRDFPCCEPARHKRNGALRWLIRQVRQEPETYPLVKGFGSTYGATVNRPALVH